MNADYNGWTNKATWLVPLWLQNDEHSYAVLLDLVERASDPYDLGERIRQLVEDAAPELGATLYADMLGVALDLVEWREIGTAMWNDYREDAQ